MIKGIQQHNQSITPNSTFLEELRTKLPEFFTADKFDNDGSIVVKGSFDLAKFQRTLQETNIEELTSGYQINFIGKDYGKKQSGERSITVIVPDLIHNSLPQNITSNNLFFTGDNLDVLRHLQNNFSDHVDMIYIDPPYNTGEDGFVYPDNFEYTDQMLSDIFGLNDVELKRLKSIQGKSTHSAWMTFIYPRIYLAKRLLKNTGTIFISIDDNELANLKLLMDEIFGESNFIAILPTVMNLKGNNDQFAFAGTHEYTIVYAKNYSESSFFELYVENEELKQWSKDSYGLFKKGANLKATGNNAPRHKRPNLFFPIYISVDNKISFSPQKDYTEVLPITDGAEMSWRWSKDKFQNESHNLIVERSSNGISIYKKQRSTDETKPTKKPKSILIKPEYSSGNGTQIIKRLFNNKKVFDFPKPVALLKDLITIGSSKDAVVMDFFAGSGTTAHAILELNANYNSNRNFILVQINEKVKNDSEAFKMDFRTIDEITRKRIELSAEKIRSEYQDVNLDLGFKHYRVVPPIQLTLDNLDKFDIESGKFINDKGQLSLEMNETNFEDMITPFSAKNLGIPGNASGIDTIITTWLVSDGYKFDVKIEKIDIEGYEAHYVDNEILYLILPNWGAKQSIELLNLIGTHKKLIKTIVLYGYSFELESIRELEFGLKSLEKQPNLLKRY